MTPADGREGSAGGRDGGGSAVRVRPATEDDLPALAGLFRHLDEHQREWRLFRPRATLVEEAEERFRRALSREECRLVVAEAGGRVVGMGLAEDLVPSRFSDERGVELSHVVVRPEVRGWGIGRALVEDLVRFAAERGVRRVVADVFAPNREALAFWESLGFVPRYVQMTALVSDLVPRKE